MAVGLLNTAFGYSLILLGLWLGAGDYAANAAGYAGGLMLAYALHRRWTFGVKAPANYHEAGRFMLAALLAYAVNLGVIYLARTMGGAHNPLTQALAMAAYSLSFFVLTRFLVFAGTASGTDSGTQEGGQAHRASHYPEWVLVGVAFLAWLFLRHLQLVGDVVWQFWIARQLLGGARLYADIWEVNPPLWFWSAVPVEWLAERVGLGWSSLLVMLVVGLGVLSAWLVAQLTDLPRPRDRLCVLLLVFAVAIILPMAGTGQREQLALLASLPYAALIARRHAGLAVPLTLALGVGLLGAYGFALKHYFTLVPLVLEVWLGLRLRNNWRPWRPELAVLIALAATYAACILIFAPEFFTTMVPMVQAAYYSTLPPIYTVFIKPYVVFWLMAALFLLAMRNEPLKETTATMAAFYSAVLLAAACFALGYFVQRRGWDYHSVSATCALAMAVGLRLIRLKHRLPIFFGGAILGWLVLDVYPLGSARVSYDPHLNHVPAGEAVFVASADVGDAWPAPDTRQLVWASRAYALWMLPAIAKGEMLGPDTPALRHLAGQVLSATSQDIRCTPPSLIVMEKAPLLSIGGKAAAFSFQGFLLRDAKLRQFVADHYAALPATPRSVAYIRRGRVEKDASLRCRLIR